MKATTIFFLVLIAFPIHLMAQQSNNFQPNTANYYAKRYFEVEAPAKHIVDGRRRSNRKGSSSAFKHPVVNSGSTSRQRTTNFRMAPSSSNRQINTGRFSNMEVQPLVDASSFPSARVAMAPVDFKINNSRAPYVRNSPIQEGAIEIASPDVAPGLGVPPSQIVRPTPDNSASGYLDAQPSVSDAPVMEAPVEPMPAEPQRDPTYNPQEMEQSLSVEPEALSLEQLRMSQQGNGLGNNRPSTMRHVTDHFSPGGEPFARRGIVGDEQFFGIDRRSCCDEWDFCNCSGGLKNNPGHLGIPWLRSKDSCDSTNPICGRHKAKHAAKCGCAQCTNSGCGCGR